MSKIEGKVSPAGSCSNHGFYREVAGLPTLSRVQSGLACLLRLG